MLQQHYNSLTVKGLGKRIGKVSTAASLTLVGLIAQMPAWAAGALEGVVPSGLVPYSSKSKLYVKQADAAATQNLVEIHQG